MTTMLARLAPEKPHVDIMVQIFLRLRTILIDLLPRVFIHGIENRDGLEADCTRRQLVAAMLTKRTLDVRLVLVIHFFLRKQELVSEHFEIGLDRQGLRANATPDLVFIWCSAEAITEDFGLSALLLLALVSIDLLLTIINISTSMCHLRALDAAPTLL